MEQEPFKWKTITHLLLITGARRGEILGLKWTEQDFVFIRDDGRSMHPDSVSISKRLGHAQVSTTANIYAHVMQEADQKNADIMSNLFLKKKPS